MSEDLLEIIVQIASKYDSQYLLNLEHALESNGGGISDSQTSILF